MPTPPPFNCSRLHQFGVKLNMERKNKKKSITVKCNHCENNFEKPLKEYKRRLKNGFNIFYCSRSCVGKSNIGNIPNYKDGNSDILKKHWENNTSLDDYSPYRFHLRASNRRQKFNNLSLEHLKEVWDSQEGRCPYSGLKMILDKRSLSKDRPRNLKNASLDRRDSSKGYEQGNVQFVCMALNFAKSDFSDEQFREFLKELKNSL